MKKKISVLVLAFITVLALALPDVSFAKGFSGGGFSSSRSSSSFSSSRSYSSPSRSYSSSSSSRSSSSSSSSKSSGWSFFGGSSSKSTSSKPKVNLSKSSSTKSGSFSGSSSYKSGYKTAAKSTISKGSFSGASSTRSVAYRSGTVYRSTPTRAYYGGHYVTVSHYYHVGYSPFGWGGYYDGFTTGMFYSSLYHPWGGTYYVGGAYTDYGPSPIAWILDVVALFVIIFIVWIIVKVIRRPKTTFTRKF